MNAKSKGTRIERQWIKDLESCGWRCIRSAGSFGPFDVVGFFPDSLTNNDGAVVLYQLKANRNPTRAEYEAMRSFAVPHFVSKAFVRKDDRDFFKAYYLQRDKDETWQAWSERYGLTARKPVAGIQRPTKRGRNGPAR